MAPLSLITKKKKGEIEMDINDYFIGKAATNTINKITNEAELYEALDIIFRQAVIAGLPIEKITAAFDAFVSYF